MKRKLDAMHEAYGYGLGLCKDCSNYQSYSYRDRRYRKCARYGETNSEATDWKSTGAACGMYNVPLACGERTMLERLRHAARGPRQLVGPVAGQVGFE